MKNVYLVDMVISRSGFGYASSTTLLATSLCCDEVNRELEEEFGAQYGDNFSMGGLAHFLVALHPLELWPTISQKADCVL